MKKLLIFLLALTFIPLIAAQDQLIFPAQKEYQLFLDCSYNETYCPSSYDCNLTISYPNTSILVNNKLMGENYYPKYNYSMPALMTLGTYSGRQVCCGAAGCSDYDFNFKVTANGTETNLITGLVYLFFLTLVGILLYASGYLTVKNPMANDSLSDNDRYELYKNKKMQFYLNLIKKKLWIVGVFGVYLSLFLFTAILGTLLINLNSLDLYPLLDSINQILAWGAIPFIIFWFVYILFTFFNSVTDIVRHQFGGFKNKQ